MKTNSTFGLGAIVVFSMVAVAAVALSIVTTTNAHAQNTATGTNQTANPQQIKDYLSQAIQALDSGNNTKAMEQVDLAGDQLESMTGTEDGEEDEDDEEEGEVEEGAGEDADEPGDVDANDQEDTP
jgi:cell division protein FtsX